MEFNLFGSKKETNKSSNIYKMYIFVLSQVRDENKATQAAMAALLYAGKFRERKEFIDFLSSEGEVIIKEGGKPSDMNEIIAKFAENNYEDYVFVSDESFNGTLTAIAVLVDEKVWDFDNYPLYYEWKIKNLIPTVMIGTYPPKEQPDPENYNKWLESVGGKENAMLKEIIRFKKDLDC